MGAMKSLYPRLDSRFKLSLHLYLRYEVCTMTDCFLHCDVFDRGTHSRQPHVPRTIKHNRRATASKRASAHGSFARIPEQSPLEHLHHLLWRGNGLKTEAREEHGGKTVGAHGSGKRVGG